MGIYSIKKVAQKNDKVSQSQRKGISLLSVACSVKKKKKKKKTAGLKNFFFFISLSFIVSLFLFLGMWRGGGG